MLKIDEISPNINLNDPYIWWKTFFVEKEVGLTEIVRSVKRSWIHDTYENLVQLSPTFSTTLSLTHLILFLPTLLLNYTRLNLPPLTLWKPDLSFPLTILWKTPLVWRILSPFGNRTWASHGLFFGKHLWFDAALYNKL